MDSIKFMQEAVRKYDSAAQMARIDRTTGLYHLDAATKIVDEYLEDFADDLNVMVTFAVDNFAETSRQYLEHYDESLVKKNRQDYQKSCSAGMMSALEQMTTSSVSLQRTTKT